MEYSSDISIGHGKLQDLGLLTIYGSAISNQKPVNKLARTGITPGFFIVTKILGDAKWIDRQTTALHNGFVIEPNRTRGNHHGEYVKTTRGLTKDGDVIGIPIELRDVFPDPLKRTKNIQGSVVTRIVCGIAR